MRRPALMLMLNGADLTTNAQLRYCVSSVLLKQPNYLNFHNFGIYMFIIAGLLMQRQ